MIGFFIGLCIGQAVVLFFTRIMYKRMARSNALIANESDYYFQLMKLAVKMLHRSDQELFVHQPATKRIRKTFDENKKRIERTGKY